MDCGAKKIVVEVKSLNSKQLDVSLKTPSLYKEKDIEIRRLIKERLDRGKVDMTVYFDNDADDKEVAVNKGVVARYFRQMLEVAEELGAEPDRGELLQTVMRFPDCLQVKAEELEEEEWLRLRGGIVEALERLNRFREQEGRALIADILRRVPAIRQRLQEKLREWGEVKNVDENRLEQEIIYYLEKLDITEEKVRLANHCRYFVETAEREETPGRKLGFIAQEIGREINTMGSKANDHDLQKLVVRMKDELEKIKEQCLNVL